MQTEPTAHHSPIGLFQRVCYLVRLASDARVPAARGTRPPAPTLIGVVLDRRGQTEVTVDPSGVGVLLQGGRATLAYQPGSSGGGRGHQAARLVCPHPDKVTWAGSPLVPHRPRRSPARLQLAERLGSINAAATSWTTWPSLPKGFTGTALGMHRPGTIGGVGGTTGHPEPTLTQLARIAQKRPGDDCRG
jgi:hypothetical protein